MSDESKDINEQKVQNIFKLINELPQDTKNIDRIKKRCVELQNSNASQQKTKYLKNTLKEFTKYPELNELIQGLKVINLCHNAKNNIVEMGEDSYYSYKINLNDVIELEYTYSIEYSRSSTLYYRTYDNYSSSHENEIAECYNDYDSAETQTVLWN